jgi:hypothetical protein
VRDASGSSLRKVVVDSRAAWWMVPRHRPPFPCTRSHPSYSPAQQSLLTHLSDSETQLIRPSQPALQRATTSDASYAYAVQSSGREAAVGPIDQQVGKRTMAGACSKRRFPPPRRRRPRPPPPHTTRCFDCRRLQGSSRSSGSVPVHARGEVHGHAITKQVRKGRAELDGSTVNRMHLPGF